MGMTKASLDFQIQQETQKAIATLQGNMQHLNQMLQIIDNNMRQAYGVLMQDMTRITVRVNFLLDELKSAMTDEEKQALEQRFKAFSEAAAEKMQKEVAAAIEAREKAAEEAKAKEPENVIKP